MFEKFGAKAEAKEGASKPKSGLRAALLSRRMKKSGGESKPKFDFGKFKKY